MIFRSSSTHNVAVRCFSAMITFDALHYLVTTTLFHLQIIWNSQKLKTTKLNWTYSIQHREPAQVRHILWVTPRVARKWWLVHLLPWMRWRAPVLKLQILRALTLCHLKPTLRQLYSHRTFLRPRSTHRPTLPLRGRYLLHLFRLGFPLRPSSPRWQRNVIHRIVPRHRLKIYQPQLCLPLLRVLTLQHRNGFYHGRRMVLSSIIRVTRVLQRYHTTRKYNSGYQR